MSELRDRVAEIVGDPAYESDPMGIADRILAAVTEGAEPVAWTHADELAALGIGCDAEMGPTKDHNYDLPLYTHPPVARESELRKALRRALGAMDSATVFVTSRERINRPTGEEWWEEEMKIARTVLDSTTGGEK